MIRIFASLSLTLLVALYFGASDLKLQTREAREELRDVDRAIEREKEAISVLSAEWSHLTRPSNLRKLAEAHLGLDLVRAEQIAAIEDVPYLGFDLFDKDPQAIPVRHKEMPLARPQTTPQSDSVLTLNETGLITVAQVDLFQFERRGH